MEEENFITISSLSEFYYCKRRYYLRELEKQSNENIYMIEGTIQHKEVHTSNIKNLGNFIQVTGMLVSSNKYQIIGKTDLIEFVKNNNGMYVKFLDGNFNILPIEYKHGIVKNNEEYKIQLCGQCLCLEEMFNCKINIGCLYYIDSDERIEIEINNCLRDETISTINEIKNLTKNPKTIMPIYKKHCKKCSLFEICNPNITIINNYINKLWEEI